MPSAYRWVCEKPSKSLILAIILLAILIQTDACLATEPQNKTLTEVKSYNFTDGYYNVVKLADNSESDFWVMHETIIPYLNLTYTASSDGYLDIYLKPIKGPFPYIELDDEWEINSLTYSKSLMAGETAYFVLSPPMIFSSSNSSRIVGGSIILWEMYKWSDLSGLINYSFTSTDDILFNIIWYPTAPRQGDKISLFADSNVEIHDITWTITGAELNWVNESEVLEISNLKSGEYSVSLLGYDEFNNSHTAEAAFIIKPPVIEPTVFDIEIFSLTHPDIVYLGDQASISATIDYTIPGNIKVKCILSDPVNSKKYTENLYTFVGDGSSNFSYLFEATQSGVNTFILQLFYNDGENWVELVESQRAFTISINEFDESQKMPGFDTLSIMAGLLIALALIKWKIINE